MGEWQFLDSSSRENLVGAWERESDGMFDLASEADQWEAPTGAGHWQVRDVIGHLVDTTEAYFVSFDAARGRARHQRRLASVTWPATSTKERRHFGELNRANCSHVSAMIAIACSESPPTSPMMSGRGSWFLTSTWDRSPPPSTHSSNSSTTAFHSWDIRQGTGSSHGLDGDSADLLVPLAFILWQSTPDVPAGTETYMVGVEVTGRNAGQHRVTVGPDGVAVEESDLDDLPAVIELDAASLVLTAYGRMNAGTIRGDRVVWHPVLLAEQIGTLASIAAGRFVLQCGLGDGSDQFAAMGAAIVTRVSRFEATLDIVRRLLNAEEVTHTEHFGVRGARISPVPPEPVEIWLAGHARAALDRASRMADGWIAGPDVSLSAAASLADAYRRSCADRDRAPGAVAIRRDVYVGHNQADAERVLNGAIAAGYRGFDPSVLVSGTADGVVAQLGALGDAGFDEVVVRHFADSQDDVLASFAPAVLSPGRDHGSSRVMFVDTTVEREYGSEGR